MSKYPKKYTYDEIKVGQRAEFEVAISEKLIADFALLSGDKNPLHIDSSYAATTPFGRPVAHGMIAGMLFSRLVGMELPGGHSIYLSQHLAFHHPIYAGDTVVVSGVVKSKTDSYNTVALDMEVRTKSPDELKISGRALVRVLL